MRVDIGRLIVALITLDPQHILTSPMKGAESSKSQRDSSRNSCDGIAGDSGSSIGREEVALRAEGY